MQHQDERRAHQRFSCEQSVSLQIDGTRVDGTIRDLSAGGLYVSVRDDHFDIGGELSVHLEDHHGQPLEIRVVVARVRKDSFGRVTAVGLKLIDDDPAWVAHVEATAAQ